VTIRAPYVALRHLILEHGQAGDVYHPADLAFLLASYVIKFEHDWIILTAIYALMLG
jgi:hypothetical protein